MTELERHGDSVFQQSKQKQQKRTLFLGGPGIRRTQNNRPIIYHVTTGSLSEYTKAAYQYNINDFLAFYKITDIQGIEPLREHSAKLIRQMIIDFVIFLRDERKASRSSIRLYCAALSHFFYMIRDDDTRLNWTKVKMEFPPDERIHRDRAYTIEEIQKMLDKGCSGKLRERAILLLLTSTGMRIGGIHPLRKRDLTPKQTAQGKVYRVEVYSQSSARYICYCNVETAKAIDEYLKERSDKGEVIQNDSPLFRDLRILNVRNVKPLTGYSIKYIVSKIVERSGIQSTFQFTGEASRSKGLRKFYKTVAEESGMKPIHVEKTHGHSIGISSHYYRPQESDILEDYITHAADALTISNEHRLNKQVEKLEGHQADEIANLKAELRAWEPVQQQLLKIAEEMGMKVSKDIRTRYMDSK